MLNADPSVANASEPAEIPLKSSDKQSTLESDSTQTSNNTRENILKETEVSSQNTPAPFATYQYIYNSNKSSQNAPPPTLRSTRNSQQPSADPRIEHLELELKWNKQNAEIMERNIQILENELKSMQSKVEFFKKCFETSEQELKMSQKDISKLSTAITTSQGGLVKINVAAVMQTFDQAQTLANALLEESNYELAETIAQISMIFMNFGKHLVFGRLHKIREFTGTEDSRVAEKLDSFVNGIVQDWEDGYTFDDLKDALPQFEGRKNILVIFPGLFSNEDGQRVVKKKVLVVTP
ncbi:hypothetical protein HK100_004048 [Physocladia obscura]|uniref:Uncharacterized protein n=1 Tax=Physocladia obscura TaxID=109957 RepID=A0AAD5X908_9FUNG|nr:hypothetical protein HK100_004048 [Physocladia obscura]